MIDSALVAAAFDLGRPTSPMTPVASGNINQIARLTTGRGTFAVKVMNPDPNDSGFVDHIERAFLFERAAFDAGIAAPRPVPTTDGRCLATIPRAGAPDALVRVHEWVEGTALQQIVYPPPTATRIGEIIAGAHALRFLPGSDTGEWLRVFGAAHWDALAERIERSDYDWAWQYRAMLPYVAQLESLVIAARNESEAPIMGHRDADAKNFLQTPDGALILVDWDQAGPVLPQHELASLALRWGGVVLGEPSALVVRAFVDGYRSGGGDVDAFRETDCAEFVSAMMGWYELSARRALGETVGDASSQPDDKALAELRTSGATAVLRGFANLRRFAASTPRWTTLLNA